MFTKNALDPLPGPRSNGKEYFENLLSRPGVRLERIVSHGQSSPEGFWYDQEEEEWVIVLEGEAVLRFEQPDELITLCAGDHRFIPAHQRHRVESTASPTVWLALWLKVDADESV